MRNVIISSFSESETEDDVADSTGELNLITEVWVEPQHGFVADKSDNTAKRAAYDGCSFSTWPERVSTDIPFSIRTQIHSNPHIPCAICHL